jgi:amidase
VNDPLNAFCSHSTARLKGAPAGPLAGLTFAAKDLFDIEGHVTGAGNPDWLRLHAPAARTAPVVQRLVEAGADMVGKTHTDELSRGIFGENAHYGTPTNPNAPGRVPGGSSSGSAAAVAGGLVDFALGTDTGGSVRIPASFCGIFGIRPTHGRLPLDGMVGQAPSFDTIGWFARDARLLGRIGEILLDTDLKSANRPRHVIVAIDAFAIADPTTACALLPAAERIAALAGSGEKRALSQQVPLAGWLAHQRARRAELMEVLKPDVIVCLPTAPFPAPPVGQRRSAMWARRTAISTLTTIAGTLGAPQLNLPLARVDGLPVGLSILSRPGADEMLLAFAREVADRTRQDR